MDYFDRSPTLDLEPNKWYAAFEGGSELFGPFDSEAQAHAEVADQGSMLQRLLVWFNEGTPITHRIEFSGGSLDGCVITKPHYVNMCLSMTKNGKVGAKWGVASEWAWDQIKQHGQDAQLGDFQYYEVTERIDGTPVVLRMKSILRPD